MTALHTAALEAAGRLENVAETYPAAAALAAQLRELLAPATAEQDQISFAINTDDELELDDVLYNCDFSQADDGCWVRAWVWVEADEDEDDHEDTPALDTSFHDGEIDVD